MQQERPAFNVGVAYDEPPRCQLSQHGAELGTRGGAPGIAADAFDDAGAVAGLATAIATARLSFVE